MTDDNKPKKQPSLGRCPFSTSRRQLLTGLGAAAGGSLAFMGATAAGAQETSGGSQATDAPVEGASNQQQVVPFHGEHQAGVTTPRPANGLVVSFDVVAMSHEDVEDMFRRLTDRIVFLTQGGKAGSADPKLPPPDSGILGPEIEPDALTVTVGLGDSFFENRPWLKDQKPKRLQRMVQFFNDALDAERCHGDMTLQFCANLSDTNIHALRDIMKNLSEYLVIRWMQGGDVPVIPPSPDGEVESARNFLGFRDGSANPDAHDEAVMDRVVWVSADSDEPDWATGGSYQAVRIIRNFVERWDRTPLQEQEAIFGRFRDTGAPLDQPNGTESDVPDYAADPDGAITPLDAHIRLANPRTPESEENLILRRPFNYSNGVAKSGQLDQGLLFIVYQADLEKGFITVQKRLDREPLEEYIKPIGGGYFFVLPGCRPGDYLGQSLLESVNS
ncbi:UNVERIFIED_ORG: deferrochelatase/peroxidase EfeB [Martelella mediterranea]